MKAKHLTMGEYVWCDDDLIADSTHDPREATCHACLQKAASYGAAAAMRSAAVEAAGATRDPEIEKERDHAIRELQRHRKAVAAAGAFVCDECGVARGLIRVGREVGEQKWCVDCVTVAPA